jgi:hypothetical protein
MRLEHISLRELSAGKLLKVKQPSMNIRTNRASAPSGSVSANCRRVLGMKTLLIVRSHSRSAHFGAGLRPTC